jgi:hypothetical protein
MTLFLQREIPAAAVADCPTFATYSQQTIGTKYPNLKEMTTLRRRAKQFFVETPLAGWPTVVSTVGYLRARRRRVDMAWAVFNFVPQAFRDGFLPELDPRNHERDDPYVDAEIAAILATETDPWWVGNLTLAYEPEARRVLVRMWRNRVVHDI